MKSYTGVGGSMEEKEAARKGSLGSKAEGGDTTVAVAFGRSAREICFNEGENRFCFINYL